MSNKHSLSEKLISQQLDDEISIPIKNISEISHEELKNYALMQQNPASSEAYILSKKHDINLKCAQEAIKLFGYSKAIEFTELFFKTTDGKIDYLKTLRLAHKEGFSVLKKELSLLEQEVMNFESKFNLNLTQTYHKELPSSSAHYYEHLDSRLDRLDE
jgi:hypothetical protein